MKIAFYDTKPYDRLWFDKLAEEYGYTIKYFEHKLNPDTAVLSAGFDVVCSFVNDIINQQVIDTLYQNKVKLIALRSAGFNHVDFKAAYEKVHVVRVPSYSPSSVAEHAAALLLSVNRKTHRAYVRTRDNNFSINGLMGIDLRDKVAGIIGTGKIGRIFIDILKGFGMRVLANDAYPDPNLDVEYVSLDQLFSLSHVVSLHCPLTEDTYHLINRERVAQMKEGTILINTSRGALVDTEALLEGLKSGKIGAAGLDVYEEENEYFFEDKSNEILQNDELARLLSLPNVLVTSHQAFFTREAVQAIAITTMENIYAFEKDQELVNEVCYQCDKVCPKEGGVKRCFEIK
ncbi:2-hydroxyacid dehydrogenase [Oscillospiraceae bacterium MB08-C2-2]|nr:2-hydroxyacid dehydrogenase [Oscillospiraceae bacterium MB08-C2-2]